MYYTLQCFCYCCVYTDRKGEDDYIGEAASSHRYKLSTVPIDNNYDSEESRTSIIIIIIIKSYSDYIYHVYIQAYIHDITRQ